MIVYKYAPYESGRKIIAGNSIGFACASDFNDPFELTGYPTEVADSPALQIFADIRSGAKRDIWARNTGILCLTRSALNPLMWAHYADAHRGFVFGFDAKVAGLTSPTDTLLPAQFGSMIYTGQKPTHEVVASAIMEVGSEFSYRPELLEKLQRLFLYKPLCWSYEEEVRVVKCIKGIDENPQLLSGSFTVLLLGDRHLYLIALPDNSIREVYLGVRNPIADRGALAMFTSELHGRHPDARILKCAVGETEWSLESHEISEWNIRGRKEWTYRAKPSQTC